jgi:hypothetical protein
MTTTSDLSSSNPVVAAVRHLGTDPDAYGPTLNTAVSVAAVERVGKALADQLRPYGPNVVSFWNTGDEAVLGHVVARELGASVLRADDVKGVLSFSGELPTDARVALLATAWTNARWLESLSSVMRSSSADVVVIASVLAAPEQPAGELPVVALVPGDALDTALDGQADKRTARP